MLNFLVDSRFISKSVIIKSFIILAVLRQSVRRTCGARLRAIMSAGNIAPLEEMSQRRQAVGNTVSDLTSPRFEPQAFRLRNKRVQNDQK